MNREDVTDDMLMSLSDGEMGEPGASALRARIAVDPELKARFDVFETSRAAARAALAPIAEAPSPDRLAAAIRAFEAPSAVVTPFSETKSRPVWTPMRMAAGFLVAAFIGGFSGYALRGADAGIGWHVGPAVAERDLIAALALTPSESTSEWRTAGDAGTITPTSAYRLDNGEVCRAFEVRGESQAANGLACGAGGAWRIMAAELATSDDDGFLPAGGAALFDTFLDARGAIALTAEEESALLARGWE